MKTILAGLEEEACVRREPYPTDGRQILFAITRKGPEERERRKAAKRGWLLAKLEKFDPQDVAMFGGVLTMGVFASVHFGRVRREGLFCMRHKQSA